MSKDHFYQMEEVLASPVGNKKGPEELSSEPFTIPYI